MTRMKVRNCVSYDASVTEKESPSLNILLETGVTLQNLLWDTVVSIHFAPIVLEDNAREWYEIKPDQTSPYMLLTTAVSENKCIPMSEKEKGLFGIEKLNVKRSEIPAVTHIDYSARVQTVSKTVNPKVHAMMSEFEKLSGCPVLINTSFNIRGEPIVCTPKDAFKCFIGTELDVLVVENLYMEKEDQDMDLRQAYEAVFELD